MPLLNKPDSQLGNGEPAISNYHNNNYNTTARSVVTFYHEGFDESSPFPIKQEVDLLDYEVLVEIYKFLAKNLRKHKQKEQQQAHTARQFRLQGREDDEEENIETMEPPNRSNNTKTNSNTNDNTNSNIDSDIVTNRHKQAILTLVEVDTETKRVVKIRPEFFPSNTTALPACLSRLTALTSLDLDHCQELTCLPSNLSLPSLEELFMDVTSFREPFPSSFGNRLQNLRKLVIKGNCTSLEHWGTNTRSSNTSKRQLLFPPSMANLTNLKHLETHIRNLLQIPSKVLDSWSLSLETLVTTQDLLASSNNTSDNSSKQTSYEHTSYLPPICNRTYSTDEYSSDDDDFYHLYDSSDDDISSEDEYEDDNGFSLLGHKNSSLFRKALETQLEVRAFSAIAKFKNLRSLKLLFDDSKHRTDIGAIRSRNRKRNRNRLKRNQQSSTTLLQEIPYCVPLSLLAGPLSMTLLELDIGTTVAVQTPSSSFKKSRIPIEIAWIDILQDFPMLQKLRLQDCRASFSNKTQRTTDHLSKASAMVSEQETVLWMPELRHLILDRCPHFAIVENNSQSKRTVDERNSQVHQKEKQLSPTSSFQDDIEIIDEKDIVTDYDDDEEIVFCRLPEKDTDQVYFQSLNDEDVDFMAEDDPEEISRIIRLSGLLADTVLTPTDNDHDNDDIINNSESQQLVDLCTMFLKRCPKLEYVSLRDCKIPHFCEELLECLPKKSLRELTLDVLEKNEQPQTSNHNNSNIRKDYLWNIVKAYPLLERLQGTCLDGISDSDTEALQRLLRQNKRQQGSMPHSPNPWNSFWDHHKKQKQPQKQQDGNKNSKDDELLLEIRFPFGQGKKATTTTTTSDEDDQNPPSQSPPQNAFKFLAAIEQKLFFLDLSRRRHHHHRTTAGPSSGGRVLQTIRRSNSRDVL